MEMATMIGVLIALIVGISVGRDATYRYPKGSLMPMFWGIGVWLFLIAFLPAYLIMRPPRKK